MHVFAVPDLPEFTNGDAIAAKIEANSDIRDDDVVCIASTIVSKVEGRAANLSSFDPSPRADRISQRLTSIHGNDVDPRFIQAIIQDSTELITEAPFILSKTEFGHIGVNAGIDRSNTGSNDLLLLPNDPSRSAAQIREAFSADPAVIVTDTSGRPFRTAQRGVAIGWAGIPATRDWRGEIDRDGHELEVTVESVIDELSAAANLVTGEGNGGFPVAVIRDFEFGEHDSTDTLYRAESNDIVRSALKEWKYGDENNR
jgi:coenzyme F420-0:L-glutamate ligase/coenzyme F420-1:gamma-L-glutamate ligase